MCINSASQIVNILATKRFGLEHKTTQIKNNKINKQLFSVYSLGSNTFLRRFTVTPSVLFPVAQIPEKNSHTQKSQITFNSLYT